MMFLPSAAPPTVLKNAGLRLARSLMKDMASCAAAALLLSACTNPGTTALGINVPLAPAPDLAGAATPGVVVWRAPELAARERAASGYLIPPATVYRGRGSYFADLSPQQVDEIAADLTKKVRAEVGRHFKVVNATGPGVYTLDLILVKVDPPRTQYVGSGPYNISALAVGIPDAVGTIAGTMTVSGKFTDSETGKLLVGFSAPVSPQVMDLAAPGNPARAIGFARAASQQFASDLVKAITRTRQNIKAMVPK